MQKARRGLSWDSPQALRRHIHGILDDFTNLDLSIGITVMPGKCLCVSNYSPIVSCFVHSATYYR
jgi:hypothetical protein